jgi:hypothetical protein
MHITFPFVQVMGNPLLPDPPLKIVRESLSSRTISPGLAFSPL